MSAQQRSQPKRIKVEVPPDLEPTYANLAVISHSPSEVVVDFARILPNSPAARVCARIIITPLNAKLLLQALQQNLKRYEARYGEIRLPSPEDDLARQFFEGIKPPETDT